MALTELETVLLISVAVLIYVVLHGNYKYDLLRARSEHMLEALGMLADRKARIFRDQQGSIIVTNLKDKHREQNQQAG